MIHYQFSIYDQKAGAYLPPFILPRIEMAKRTFGDCINSDSHQFAAHPEDYTLFLLGTWDDETSLFKPEDNGPKTLGNGVEYVQSTNTEDKSNAAQRNGASIQPGSPGSDSA